MLSFGICFLRVPSLISPPEPAAPSPSLPDPAFERGCREKLEGLREIAGRDPSGADDEGGRRFGEVGREGGWMGCEPALPSNIRCFFRDDSFPLASEMLGEPGRLRDLELVEGSGCLLKRPDGVFVPRVEASEGALDFLAFSWSDALAFLSASFLRSSSFSISVAVSSDSLCSELVVILTR